MAIMQGQQAADSGQAAAATQAADAGAFTPDNARAAARALIDGQADAQAGEGDAQAAPDKAAEKDKPGEKDKKEEEKIAPGLLALKREQNKLRADKAAFEGERVELTTRADQAEGLIGKLEGLAKDFLVNPVPLAEAFGATTAEHYRVLAQHFWVKAVGPENAPKEWQDQISRNTFAQQLDALKAENQRLRESWEKRDQERTQVAEEQAYRQSIAAAISQNAADVPHVAAFAKKDPAAVIDALFALADELAAEEKKIPDEARLVAILEQNLTEELGTFGELYERKQAQQQRTSSTGKQATRTTTKTLSNTTMPPEVGRARSTPRTEEDRLAGATRVLQTHFGQR